MGIKVQKQIDNLVSSIVSSYDAHPHTCHINSGSLPCRESVVEIIDMMRELLFPGYVGKQDLTSETVEFNVGNLIVRINDALQFQIANALRLQARKKKLSCEYIDIQTDEIVLKFLAQIPRLREILATDVQAAFDGDPAAGDTDEIIFSYPGIFAVTVYRLAHELYLLSVPFIPRIMSEYAHNVTGIDINAGARIGKYFFIDHGTGVVIGETTVIGDNVKIYQGVTLGALSTRGGQSLRGAKRHPTIEDNVTVYSGASILGGETIIGDGVLIGSNVFITKSVPDRTRVSVKNPELQFKGQASQEFKQEDFFDWVI